MTPTIRFFVALVLLGLAPGCVTRRYLITTDPPGALVFRDGQPLGPTPLEQPFLYYGTYRFQLVKDGYQTLDVTPELCAPFYEWPGLDFISETLIPYHFRDVQPFHYVLQPLVPDRPDEVRGRAEELRRRGEQISPRPPAAAPAPAPPPGAPAGSAIPPVPAPTPAPPEARAPLPAAPTSAAAPARPSAEAGRSP
jgi:hypothetical protein